MHYNESFIERLFRESYERFTHPPNSENDLLGYDPNFFLEQEYPIQCGRKTYFADFYEPSCKIVIELDGYNYHEKDKKQIEKDKKRERDLVMSGYKILRFTGGEIRRNPTKVLTEIYSNYCKFNIKN